ncbi:MAG: ribose-phosphate pyrophosphokinase [Chloroflexi bacterium]|nr:ribose-phosphate pyrophosphokinase [Chloroflexota bacterium]
MLDAGGELAGVLRIFSGSSHPELAQEIANYLQCPLCRRTTSRFTNDNLFVRLEESVRGKDVVIIQSFSPGCEGGTSVSDNVLEMFLMLDAARSASAKSVHAVIPYFSYARSDKKDEPRISIAARLMADLLATAGAGHVMTMTLHSPQVHGFFSVPTDHLTAQDEMVRHFRNRDLSNTVVVAPDMGHAKRALKLARALGTSVAAADKERIDDKEVHIERIIGDVAHKDAIVLDDEIATGGSMIALVELLIRHSARKITLACTHGVFCGSAIERLGNMREIEEIVTTNTVPIPPEKRLPNMTILSVAPIFGEAIRRNILGQSVGSLFAYWPDQPEG